MNKIGCFLVFSLIAVASFSQQKEELFFETFEAIQYSNITINSSYGNIYIVPSHDQLGARVEFIYSEEIAEKSKALFDQISVKSTVNDTGVVLTTVFDQALFLKNNMLWDIKDDINIEFRVKVPPHVRVQINQKHGSVYTGKISNPISVKLDNSGLFAKFSEQLQVKGTDFRVDASAVNLLSVEGSQGHVALAYVKHAKLNLSYCSVESFGFEQLEVVADHAALSIGKTNSCEVKATNSTIEFTDIIDQGKFELTDVKFVVQKLPEQFICHATRGDSKFTLEQSRNIQMHLVAKDSESELVLRGGSIQMVYSSKKTGITIPSGGTLTKKLAEFVQSGTHGIKMNAEMMRGQLTIRK